MGILEILSSLLQFIRDVLWPFFIVSAPSRGVRYTFGVPGVTWWWWWGFKGAVLEPGPYFCIPWAQEIKLTNCAEDTIDISNLALTSHDGVQVTVSYNLKLKVDDPLKYQLNLKQDINPKASDSVPSAIHAEGSTAVSSMIRRRRWERIYKSQGHIERRVTAALTNKLSNWGVTVISGGLTICSQAVPIALINVT